MTIKEYKESLKRRGYRPHYELADSAMDIWNNDSCTGYAIAAAEIAGLSVRQIVELVDQLALCYDSMSVEEAEAYCKHFRRCAPCR